MNQLAEPIRTESTRHHYLLPDVRCAGCCLKIERTLAGLPGVRDVSVSYALKRLSFSAPEHLVGDVLEKVDGLGYSVKPDESFEALNSYRAEQRGLLARLGVAGIGMMQVMMYALATYLAPEGGMDPDLRSLFRWASLVIAIPVTFYSAMPFHRGALRDLKARTVGMDVPVSLAILSAFSLSFWHTITGSGEVYFDSACMFTFFLLTGRYLESSARRKFQVETSLGDHLLPTDTTLAGDEVVPVRSLKGGEHLTISPGEVIPADCRILAGRTTTDESAFTGESRPVNKPVGARLLAGSRNLDGTVEVEVSAAFDTWLINRLGERYREAAGFRPQFAILADRVARYFVAVILLLAAASGLYWSAEGRVDAFAVALSVLVVSCPCALSLATPVAYSIATGALSRMGVLVSRGAFLEKIRHVDTVVLDKTGTLTEGRLHLSEVRPLADIDRQALINVAASLEEKSLHPVADTLRDAATQLHPAQDARVLPGCGVSGRIDGVDYRFGKPDFAAPGPVAVPPGRGTWVLLSTSQDPLAWFCFADSLRADTNEVLHSLKSRFDHIAVFSGDTAANNGSVLQMMGAADVRFGMSPEDKIDALQALQAQGRKVLMVGDGLNDTGAMAAADVSIAISPVDMVVQSAADATLVSNRLVSLLTMIEYSGRVSRIIRQNISWALAYNLTVIPLAVMGLLSPWVAALGMSLSSLAVTINACRLAR